MESKVKVNRGDIFYVRLTGTGSVQSGLRPVIVISNNANNMFGRTVNVVPCTTKIKSLPVHVDMSEDCGFTQVSQALCEQVVTVSKESLGKKIGTATELDMKRIERAMLIQFGMGEEATLPRVVFYGLTCLHKLPEHLISLLKVHLCSDNLCFIKTG